MADRNPIVNTEFHRTELCSCGSHTLHSFCFFGQVCSPVPELKGFVIRNLVRRKVIVPYGAATSPGCQNISLDKAAMFSKDNPALGPPRSHPNMIHCGLFKSSYPPTCNKTLLVRIHSRPLISDLLDPLRDVTWSDMLPTILSELPRLVRKRGCFLV